MSSDKSSHQPSPSRGVWNQFGLSVAVLGLVAVVALGLVLNANRNDQIPGEPRDSLTEDSAEEYEPPVLAKEEVKYLQDAEHLGGFVLGDLAFPKFAKALKAGDRNALLAFFHEDFAGSLFDSTSGGSERDYGFVKSWSWHRQAEELATITREQFVDGLLDQLREIDDPEQVKLKVMMMAPVEAGKFDGQWTGSCKLILSGKVGDEGLSERVSKFNIRIDGISDETADKPGWLLGADIFSSRLANVDRPMMQDMTAETGLDVDALFDTWDYEEGKARPYLTGGIYLADYNQDGLMDALVTDLNGLFLYQGLGAGQFKNVTVEVGLNPNFEVLGALFADFDSDGFEDLIVGSYIYRNVKGQRFERIIFGRDTTLNLNPSAFKYAVADYDRDGHLDVYVVGLSKESDTQQKWIGRNDMAENQLWRNKGNWQFENVTETTGTKGGGSQTFAAVWFDANRDDWPDLMTSCEFGQNDYFLNNQDGTFRPGIMPDGYGGFSMGITVSDIDNDGFGDPYVANMYSKAGERILGNLRSDAYPPEIDAQLRDFVKGNELYHNRGDGQFNRIGIDAGVADAGWAYGTGFVDINCDGLPDMYSPTGYQSVTHSKPDG